MSALDIVRAAFEQPEPPSIRRRVAAVERIALARKIDFQTASRLLDARIRLNRAGTLRYRNEPPTPRATDLQGCGY